MGFSGFQVFRFSGFQVFRLSAISHQMGVPMRDHPNEFQVGVPIKGPIQGGEDADLSVSFDGVMSWRR